MRNLVYRQVQIARTLINLLPPDDETIKAKRKLDQCLDALHEKGKGSRAGDFFATLYEACEIAKEVGHVHLVITEPMLSHEWGFEIIYKDGRFILIDEEGVEKKLDARDPEDAAIELRVWWRSFDVTAEVRP